ncbi:MAG: class I SAM-dependent methyltransferase [Oscillospiraceae bacterium]|nr:class I SAM-dependent methyltransferase [Oscillospiraceae bacterium]
MDLRLTFNEDPENYNRFRPTYTEKLFEDVIRFSDLSSSSAALEIGIGTGQATLPFLKTDCKITAIELGDRLAQFTRKKFADYKNLDVITQDFESAPLDENAYDLIYSATAFHWIPPEIGLPKVHRLLKSGGVFAWFSLQPAPAPECAVVHEEIEKVYEKYNRYFSGEKPEIDQRRQNEEKLLARVNAFKQYGFVDIQDKLYHGSRIYNSSDYVALYSTYSDHKAIPECDRIPFLEEIGKAIDRCGGKFTFADTMLLCMGRKS